MISNIVTLKAFYPLVLQIHFLLGWIWRGFLAIPQALLCSSAYIFLIKSSPTLLEIYSLESPVSLSTLYGFKDALISLVTSVLAIAASTDFAGFLT